MTDTQPLDRLPKLTAKLLERKSLVEDFQKVLEPLQQGGLEAVDGESTVFAELEEKLSAASDILQRLPAGDREPLMDELARLLDDVDWDIATHLQADLVTKNDHQADVLSRVSLDLRTWEGQVTELAKVIDGARFEGAPFSALEDDLRAARSALASIRSALGDRLYSGLPSLREAGQRIVEQLQKHVTDSEKQVDRVKKLVKQADLLIMRVGLVEGGWEYRVLLRSADRFQTRGINIIQEVREVSIADRDWMVELLKKLTGTMNDGILAAHDAAHPPAPETPAGSPPAVPVGDHPGQTSTEMLGMLGQFMFRMVIPEQIQLYLMREPWSFSITTNDLELPWELLCFEGSETDGGSALRYLCLERSVSRMPLGGIFPPTPPRRASGRPRKRRMLLIHSDRYNELPAAADEVETIARELANELEFERVKPSEATNAHINDLLMGQSFDFLHYAGHAIFDADDPNGSGLQLTDSLLTAEKIRKLNKGGSLVFLNACESGTVARETQAQRVSYLLSNPEPVVGLASAFVYSGALGCVGSLWPVYDRPAADLAVRFYRYVLAGEPTGEALRHARADIRDAYPREITWAGYVLYGDPTFRLTET